jgi:hypothetical protein
VRKLVEEDDLIDDSKMKPIFQHIKKISEDFITEEQTKISQPQVYLAERGGLEYFTIEEGGELLSLEPRTNFDQYPLFILVNTILKKIFVLVLKENVSQRSIFLAGRSATNLNSNRFKNEFTIRNVLDPLEREMILEKIGMIQEIST